MIAAVALEVLLIGLAVQSTMRKSGVRFSEIIVRLQREIERAAVSVKKQHALGSRRPTAFTDA